MKKSWFSLLCLICLLTSGILHPINGQDKLELDNDTLLVKLDLSRGGAICYLSESGNPRNIVNIHDEGRYIQQSYYAGKTLNRIADGQNPSWSPWSWNPIQVGDSYNNRAQILEHSKEGNTLYVKCIPMLWDMNNKPAEAEMEQWTTLMGNVIHVRNRISCHRTDDLYGEGLSRDQELPAVYPISSLKNLYSYFGKEPFTMGPLDNPEVINLSSGFWGRYQDNQVTENWMAFVDDDLWGLAVYTPICSDFLAGMAGSPGFEANDASTSYIAPVKKATLNKNSVFEYEYYLIVGSLKKIRSDIYSIKGVQENEWDFSEDTQGWNKNVQGGSVVQKDGALRFNVNDDDPLVMKNTGEWTKEGLHYLWLAIKNETTASTGGFHFYGQEDSSSFFFLMEPFDSVYRNQFVYLDTLDFRESMTSFTGFGWSPVKDSSRGSVSLDFVRFLKEKLLISTEGGNRIIEGLGGSLQLYSRELPENDTPDVCWSLYPEGIANITQNGLLTAVSSGVVRVVATMNDETGSSASVAITLKDTLQCTAWEFKNDVQNWNNNIHGGSVSHSDDCLVFTVEGEDPYVGNNVSPWEVGDLSYLWMRVKNKTAGRHGAMYFFPEKGSFGYVSYELPPDDNSFHDVFALMSRSEVWKKNTVLNTIRMDPNDGGEEGCIYYDFIRFMEELVTIRSETGSFLIEGLGNTLKLYADILIDAYDGKIVWQVADPSIASVNQEGVVSAVAEGQVRITATSAQNQEVKGWADITVSVDHTGVCDNKARIKVFPNPVIEYLNIHNVERIKSLSVYDIRGKIVMSVPEKDFSERLNMGSLLPGFYLIKIIYSDGENETLRMVKK